MEIKINTNWNYINMIDVIVVNWNSGEQLIDAVSSIASQKSDFVREVIIVDNDSTDNSLQSVIGISNIKIIKSFENLGFGKACNLGTQHADADFLLFLNPDAAVYPGTLEKITKFMQNPANEKVGICGVQLIDEGGLVARSCARFPNPKGFIFHAIGLDRFFPKLGHFMAEWPHDTTQDVDQLIGAFFLVRRSLFKELGGFDERFFVYFEEVDFSYRARKAGWRSIYLADVQAFHAGGGTSNQVKAKRLFYSLRSRLLYAFKHFTLPGALLVLIATLLLEPISRSALAIGRRSWSSLVETWTGYGMLFLWLPQWWFKGITR